MSKEVGGCVERLMVGGGDEVTVGGGEEVMVGDGEELAVGRGEEVTGALSLKLLTWPHTGRMTEVKHIVLMLHVYVDHVRSCEVM